MERAGICCSPPYPEKFSTKDVALQRMTVFFMQLTSNWSLYSDLYQATLSVWNFLD